MPEAMKTLALIVTMVASLSLVGCAGSGLTAGDQSHDACFYRLKDEQHLSMWGSCTVPPPRANFLLMGLQSTG